MGSDPMAKKSFRDTLSPRGVCSRIPHLRPFYRDSHGQISTHVYILHIIPFMGCLRLSVVVVSIDSHSENPRFSVQLVDTHSFVPTALTPHPTNTALFSRWCWVVLVYVQSKENLHMQRTGDTIRCEVPTRHFRQCSHHSSAEGRISDLKAGDMFSLNRTSPMRAPRLWQAQKRVP